MSNTLGELIALRMRVDACCVVCNRTRDLDLPGLIARLGGGARLEEVRARLICSICGRRNQETYLRPPGTY